MLFSVSKLKRRQRKRYIWSPLSAAANAAYAGRAAIDERRTTNDKRFLNPPPYKVIPNLDGLPTQPNKNIPAIPPVVDQLVVVGERRGYHVKSRFAEGAIGAKGVIIACEQHLSPCYTA